jgi:hypothetical protein
MGAVHKWLVPRSPFTLFLGVEFNINLFPEHSPNEIGQNRPVSAIPAWQVFFGENHSVLQGELKAPRTHLLHGGRRGMKKHGKPHFTTISAFLQLKKPNLQKAFFIAQAFLGSQLLQIHQSVRTHLGESLFD